MRLTIDLSEEDVRKLIESKISNLCSKHGHPDTMQPVVIVSVGPMEGQLREGVAPLKELRLKVYAEVELS